MVFKPVTTPTNEAQELANLAVPLPSKSKTWGAGVNKTEIYTQNAPNSPDEIAKTANSPIPESAKPDPEPQNEAISRPSLPNLNQKGPTIARPDTETGVTVAAIYPILDAAIDPIRRRLPDVLDAATLLDSAYAALIQAVQLRWGCQRVTTSTALGHWRNAPRHTEERIVGTINEEGRRAGSPGANDGARVAELDAEMFAVDLVFVDFLAAAREALDAVERFGDAQVCQERINTRLGALMPQFQPLADELTQHRAAWEKACAIDDAGGWPAEKHAAADARLGFLAQQISFLTDLLERMAPHLLPEWPSGTKQGDAA